MADVERRYTANPVEARKGGDKPKIAGYAAVIMKESRNLGGFVERLDSGAFNKSRGDGWPDVVARYNHDDASMLGTTASGSLRLYVDDYGLFYEVDPPTHRSDIVELIERGDIRHSSFAFRSVEDDWSLTEQGFPLRTLRALQLVDVSPVPVPAYPDATAMLRSFEEAAKTAEAAGRRLLDTTPALRSLAERMSASVDEIRGLAAENELRKLFVRTDKGAAPAAPRTYGPVARMALLGKQTDPWA